MIRYCTFFLFLLLINACQAPPAYQKISGNTMGTTYHIQYLHEDNKAMKSAIDSLLEVVNQSVSTYIPGSLISRYNRNDFDQFLRIDDHFERIYTQSRIIAGSSSGAFDPTIMPLVNYWGFGNENQEFTRIDSALVDSLRENVGFHLTNLQAQMNAGKMSYALLKQKPGVQLDFSAIAKGYGVDAVAHLLESQGVENYLVEIGGEVKCAGVNATGDIWTIGINTPSENINESRKFKEVVKLDHLAMATSGNYRNFKVVDGRKVVHTINPMTGFPETSNLLSASVFSRTCMTADAYATAFMVMGLDRAYQLAKRTDGVEAYFIYVDKENTMQVKYTPWIDSMIVR